MGGGPDENKVDLTCPWIKQTNIIKELTKTLKRSFDMAPMFILSVSCLLPSSARCQASLLDPEVKIAPVEHHLTFALHYTTNVVKTDGNSLRMNIAEYSALNHVHFPVFSIQTICWSFGKAIPLWLLADPFCTVQTIIWIYGCLTYKQRSWHHCKELV